VAFKGLTDDYSSFVPIKFLQRDILKVSMSLFSNGSMLISSPVSNMEIKSGKDLELPESNDNLYHRRSPSGYVVLFQRG